MNGDSDITRFKIAIDRARSSYLSHSAAKWNSLQRQISLAPAKREQKCAERRVECEDSRWNVERGTRPH